MLGVSQEQALWKVLNHDAHLQTQLRGRRSLRHLIQVVLANGIEIQNSLRASSARDAARYAIWLTEKTRHFRIPGFDQKISIDKAMNLKIVFLTNQDDKSTGVARNSTGIVEEYYASNTSESRSEKNDALYSIDFNQRIIVTGGPGSGKSLLLHRIVHRLSLRFFIVLFVRFRDLVRQVHKGGRTYSQALLESAFDGSNLPAASQIAMLNSADYLIADGLDECGEFSEEVAAWLNSWLLTYPKIKVLGATRPVGFNRFWFANADWDHAKIQPLEEYHADKQLADLLDAMGAPLSLIKPSLRRLGSQDEDDRHKSRWSSPLAVALAASLTMRGIPIPEHEAELLQELVRCYRHAPASDRLTPANGSPTILNRILGTLAAELRAKPSLEYQKILENISYEIAKDLGKTPLAASEDVKLALDFWEQRGLIERLMVGDCTYYAFVHMQLCESVASDYWNEIRLRDPVRFAQWVAASVNVAHQYEVLRLVARTGGLVEIYRALICDREAQLVITEIANLVAQLTIYAGAQRAAELKFQQQEQLEKLLLDSIQLEVTEKSALSAEYWIELPWEQRLRTEQIESALLELRNFDLRLFGMAIAIRHTNAKITNGELIKFLAVKARSRIRSAPGGGLRIDSNITWTLYNSVISKIFSRLDEQTSPEILSAAQASINQNNFSARAAEKIRKIGSSIGLDVSILSGHDWRSLFSPESQREERLKDIEFLNLLADLSPGNIKPDEKPFTDASELINIGVIWSALNMHHLYPGDYLRLWDRKVLPSFKTMIKAILWVFEIDPVQLLQEILAVRSIISQDPWKSLYFTLPNVPVTSFRQHHDCYKPSDISVEEIVKALFCPAPVVAGTAANFINDSNCPGDLTPLVNLHLPKAPLESMRLVSYLAEGIWGPEATKRLMEELMKPPRPGLSYFAKRMLKEHGSTTDPILYAEILRLAHQKNVYEAEKFSAFLLRFDPSFHDPIKICQLFCYWIKNQPPLKSGESTYESPLVAISQILKIQDKLSKQDLYQLRQIDRYEVRKFIDGLDKVQQ